MSNKDFSVPRNKSLAPGRTPFRPTDVMGRQIGSGPLNRRATSVGPSAANPSTKNDPRPVKNPEYIRSCALRVEDFVRSIAPGAVLSPKAFASPTVKDFEVIWETLFSAFDAKWCKKAKGRKIEELVPYVLKSLGYPISVSKSALSAPGSTHSWPQIILALDWFVTIIEMNNSYDMSQTDTGQDLMQIEEDGMLDSAKTFDWLCESYAKYMDFDDVGCEEVDNGLISKILEDQEQQKEHNEKLRCELERVSTEVASLQQKPSPLLEAKREIKAMEQDEVSLQSEIQQLEEVTGRLQKKAAEYEVSIKMKREETQAIVKQTEEIRARVATQKVTREDINRLLNEKQKVEQMLENAIAHKNSVEQEVNNKEIQLDSLLNGLECIVHEYNNKVSETIPIEDRQSLDVDLFIALNRNATKAEEVCDIEQKERITNALLSLKQKYTEQNKALVEEGQRLESLYSQQLNKTVETQQQHVELVSELERLRQESMRNKEALASFKQNGEEQLRLREDEIQRIKQHGVEMIQDVNQRVAEAEAAYQKLFEECEEEKQNVLDEQRKKVEIYKRVQRDVSAVSQRLRKVNEKAIKEAQDLIPKDKE